MSYNRPFHNTRTPKKVYNSRKLYTELVTSVQDSLHEVMMYRHQKTVPKRKLKKSIEETIGKIVILVNTIETNAHLNRVFKRDPQIRFYSNRAIPWLSDLHSSL